MSGIISFLGSILGWLMYFSYHCLHNYFWAIVFFYVLDEDRTASSITDGTEEFD